MTDHIKKVFFDTSFFIRLYKTDDPDHQNAKAYYRRFRERDAEFFLSTIVAAEFGTGAEIPNDTKILAQAEEIGANLFIARDDNCEKVYTLMKDNGLLSFEYLDLRTPPTEFFSELFPDM